MHWLIRVGDGKNFLAGAKFDIWGVNSNGTTVKCLLKNVKQGDILWFVKSSSKGLLIAVATYERHNVRVIGPLITTTNTNKELGWVGDGNWDTEIHYSKLYNLEEYNLLTDIKGAATIRRYNDKCKVNLPQEYGAIVRYLKS